MSQFDSLEEQGTRILIYNLWEDDEGKLELDFDTDPHVICQEQDFSIHAYKFLYTIYLTNDVVNCLQDIQLRGVNRDEKNIEMAKTYPNSRHFLTYRHSLRVCGFMFLD